MFKLLTVEEENKVRQEYIMRRAIVMLSALIFVLVVGIIGLLPSYVLSNARQNEVLERMRIAGNSEQSKEDLSLQAWLTKINNELRVLSPKLDADKPSDFIEKILSSKNTGIQITGFSWKRAEAETSLSVSGIARDRQTLIAFQNSINLSGNFSDIDLPISDLAENKNIDFQIKFLPKEIEPNSQTP
jgi:hypothetical protein